MNLISKTKSKLSALSSNKDNNPTEHATTPEDPQKQQQVVDQQSSSTSSTRSRALSLGRKTPQRAPPSFQRHGGSLNPAGNVKDDEGIDFSINVPPIPGNAHVHGDYGITDFDRYKLETASTEPVHEGKAVREGQGVEEVGKRKGVVVE